MESKFSDARPSPTLLASLRKQSQACYVNSSVHICVVMRMSKADPPQSTLVILNNLIIARTELEEGRGKGEKFLFAWCFQNLASGASCCVADCFMMSAFLGSVMSLFLKMSHYPMGCLPHCFYQGHCNLAIHLLVKVRLVFSRQLQLSKLPEHQSNSQEGSGTIDQPIPELQGLLPLVLSSQTIPICLLPPDSRRCRNIYPENSTTTNCLVFRVQGGKSILFSC